MMENHNWLAEYVRTGADEAFREVVSRYLDLVYSTALRLVDGDAHRAEDVAQTVFVHLARVARTLPADVKLGGWLHRDTCFAASTLMRGERRRAAREREAAEMNANNSGPDFLPVTSLLDEAINQLGEADRAAILLRFFEQQDFRSVGAALGSNEDAARMRVTRALEKLEGFLKRRGVTTTAAGLGVALTAQAVQSAPAGLALTISTAALAGTTATATATVTVIKTMAMTLLQKTLVAAALVIVAGAGIYEARQAARLRDENQSLRQQQGPLSEQLTQLQGERDAALKRLADLAAKPGPHLPAPRVSASAPPAEDLESTNLYTRLKDQQPKLTREQAESYLTANGRTASTLLAAFRTSGDPELLKEAMQKYPNDPQVAFEAAMAKDLSPAEQRQWLDAFEKNAPNNALANYLSAYGHFNAGQVDEGIQELTAAAGKSFDDYSGNRAQDDVEAFLAAGYPLADAKTFGMGELMLPQLSQMKQLGLNLVDLAGAYRQSGDQASAQAALQLAVNMGQNYASPYGGENFISQLVGIVIVRNALNAMDPGSPYGNNGQTVQDELNQLTQQKSTIQQLNQQFDPLQQKMTDQDWINYRDRDILFGEAAAEQWVVNKYGGN